MGLSVLAVLGGLVLLVWSADRFVEGAAAVARHHRVPSLVIGMVIVGFGTSLPELLVSVMAAFEGNGPIALGNVVGSNSANIGLILGVAALVRPLDVQSGVLRRELPLLTAATALAAWQLRDGVVDRSEAGLLLFFFALFLLWTLRQGEHGSEDALAVDVRKELEEGQPPTGRAWAMTLSGLVVLVASSRLLVWGAVSLARALGVSELFIGLTLVAVGTSLPELASSVVAARKGESDLAIGNVLGSNLFNGLAVVGVAGLVAPLGAGPALFARDVPVMGAFTLSVFLVGVGIRGPGRIERWEGFLLLAAYGAYTAVLLRGSVLP